MMCDSSVSVCRPLRYVGSGCWFGKRTKRGRAWKDALIILICMVGYSHGQDIFQAGALQGTGATTFTPALYHGIYATVGSYSRYFIIGINSTMQTWDTAPIRKLNFPLWPLLGITGGIHYSSNPFNTTNPISLRTFHMEPDLFLCFGQGTLNTIKFQVVLGFDVMTGNSTENSKFTSIWAGTAEIGTTFAFVALLPTTSTYSLARWDKGTSTLTEGPIGLSTARGLSIIQSNSIVIGGTSNTLDIYDKTSLVFIKSTAFVYQTFLMIDDNLDANSLLIAHNALISASYGLTRVHQSSDTVIAAMTTTIMPYRISSMINLGTFNYVLVSYPSTNAGEIYDKTDLTLTQTYNFASSPTCTGTCSPVYHTMAYSGMGAGNQINFMMHAGDNKIYSRSIKPLNLLCSAYSGLTCISCVTGNYLLASTGQCYSQPNIPERYGIATATTILACSDSNCWKCYLDRNTCLICDSQYFLKSDAPNTCVQNNITSYGQNSSAIVPTIEPCTVNNCSDCFAESTLCLRCNAGYYLKSDAPNTCVQNIITSYGKKAVASVPTIGPCTVSNCINCFDESTLCVECTSTYAFKNDVANLCFSRSTTAYYGPTTADSKVITRCSINNCKWCATTYTECSECDANYSLVNGRFDLCHLDSTQYAGYGYDSSQPATPAKIYPCSDSNCSDCQANIQVCIMCTIASGMYVMRSDNKCYLNTIVGYGIDDAQPNYLEVCQQSSCLNCFSDYRYCQTPKSSKREMALLASGFDSARNLVNLQFDSQLEFKQFMTFLSISMKDSNGNPLTGVSVKSIGMAVNNKGIDILIEHSLNVNDTKMEIKAIDTSTCVFIYLDAEFPANRIITVEGIDLVTAVTVIDKNPGQVTVNEKGSGKSTAIEPQNTGQLITVIIGVSVSASALIVSSAGSSTVGSASFGSYLKMMSVLDYLSMTNGNRTVLSDNFLNLFQSSPLEYFNNPIAVNEDSIECTPTDNFARENISCNIMNNYGSDFMTLLLLFGIVLTLIAINKLIRHFKKKNEKSHKILSAIFFVPNALVNAEMFVAIIDGIHIEISRIAFINIFNSNSKIAQIIGLAISLILIVFYSVYAWILYLKCREYSVDRKLNANSRISKLLAFNFEEFKNNARSPLVYYTPLIIIFKNTISQLILVSMGNIGLAQIYSLLIIEAVGIVLAMWQSTGQKGWKSYGRIVVSICYCAILCLYLVLNIWTIGNIEAFGITLCALYSIIIGLQLISMIEILIPAINGLYKLFKIKKTKIFLREASIKPRKITARGLSSSTRTVNVGQIMSGKSMSKHASTGMTDRHIVDANGDSSDSPPSRDPSVCAVNRVRHVPVFELPRNSIRPMDVVSRERLRVFGNTNIESAMDESEYLDRGGSELMDASVSARTARLSAKSLSPSSKLSLILKVADSRQEKTSQADDRR